MRWNTSFAERKRRRKRGWSASDIALTRCEAVVAALALERITLWPRSAADALKNRLATEIADKLSESDVARSFAGPHFNFRRRNVGLDTPTCFFVRLPRWFGRRASRGARANAGAARPTDCRDDPFGVIESGKRYMQGGRICDVSQEITSIAQF
jgi:hypothetical protein